MNNVCKVLKVIEKQKLDKLVELYNRVTKDQMYHSIRREGILIVKEYDEQIKQIITLNSLNIDVVMSDYRYDKLLNYMSTLLTRIRR